MINYSSSSDYTDKFCHQHNYKIFYQNFWQSKYDKVLEIGLGSCGFTKFLVDNNIGNFHIGADINDIKSFENVEPAYQEFVKSKETFCSTLLNDVYHGDVEALEFKQWLENNYKNDIDLVIEDCSHAVKQQKYLISISDMVLSSEGVWITEDIVGYHNAQEVIESVPVEHKPYAYLVDLKSGKRRFDDFVVVIDRRKL